MAAAEFAKERLARVKDWLADGDINLDQYTLLKAGSILAGAILLFGGRLAPQTCLLAAACACLLRRCRAHLLSQSAAELRESAPLAPRAAWPDGAAARRAASPCGCAPHKAIAARAALAAPAATRAPAASALQRSG